MKNEHGSESYKRSTGIASGDQESIDNAIRYLDYMWVLPKGAQRRVVADMWESIVDGITSYSYTADDVKNFVRRLSSVSDRLGLEAYENIIGMLYRYDDRPDKTTEDLVVRKSIDAYGVKMIVKTGFMVSQLQEKEGGFYVLDRENFIRNAEKALKFVLKHGGTDSKLRAVEALAHFDGSELRVELNDVLHRDSSTVFVARESIDINRAREDSKNSMVNWDYFNRKYPDQSNPKRFIIDASYESIEKLLSSGNRRMVGNDTESAVAVRQLISLLRSSKDWSRNVFPVKSNLDYENDLEKQTIITDIQNALIHFVKRGKDDSLRKEAAEMLAHNGDKRVQEIFSKIVHRREPGSEFIRKFTIPKPKRTSTSMPPVLKKKATR